MNPHHDENLKTSDQVEAYHGTQAVLSWVAYPSEVIFKLVRSAPCGTNSCDKSSHAFRFGQCQEVPHFTGWKADEMQGSFSMSYFNTVHL